MSPKPTGLIALKILVAVAIMGVLLLAGGGWWYFTHGRKPKIALAIPLASQTGAGARQEVAPAKPMPVVEKKAAAPATPLVARPAPAPIPPPVPAVAAVPAEPTGLRKMPELSTGEKPDLLLAKRTERRFAKLNEWAARLNGKKSALLTPLQIEAFNEEAAKYHAELAEARAEAAARSAPAP